MRKGRRLALPAPLLRWFPYPGFSLLRFFAVTNSRRMIDPLESSANLEKAACPCQSGKTYLSCCGPFHHGTAKPETAGQLMRSRYSAFFLRLVDYLVETTHPDTRHRHLKAQLEDTIHETDWCSLTILRTSQGGPADKTGKVEFIAAYTENGRREELREHSRFKRYKGAWTYLDARG